MKLNPVQLKTACKETFEPRVLERGNAYFSMGNVISVEWNEESHSLRGSVAGNFNSEYEVEVEVLEERSGIVLDSECSCPVGYSCKHGAAIVCQYIQQLEELQRRMGPLDRWQEVFGRYHPAVNPRAAFDSSRCIVYELTVRPGRDQVQIQLEMATARRLKKGGLGKRTRLSSYDASSPANQSIQDAIDEQIIQLATAARSPNMRTITVPVEGEVGGLLLQHLVESDRCYLPEEGGPPLSFGPELEPQFQWISSSDGLQLECHLEGVAGDWICTPTTPPWYIDNRGFRAGPLRTGLEGRLIGALRMLPALGEHDARQISRRLLMDQDLTEIPQPVELDMIRIEGQAPRPKLTLNGLNSGEERARDMRYFGKLEVVYDEHLLTHGLVNNDLNVLHADDANEMLIRREMETEGGFVTRLKTLDFVPLPFGGDLCVLPDTTAGATQAIWQRFLDHGLAALEADGWQIEIDPSFSIRFVEADGIELDTEERGNGWFDVSMEIEIEGRKMSLLPLLIDWLESSQDDPADLLAAGGDTWVRYEDERYVRMPVDVLRPVLSTLVELMEKSAGDRELVSLSDQHAPLLIDLKEQLGRSGIALGRWELPGTLADLANKLHDFRGIESAPLPDKLSATLRDYQKEGLDWLQFLRQCGFGGVLADDMGLGKTVQVLANLLLEKEQGRLNGPSLIVVPTSLISNWRREISRFASDLSLLVIHGLDRHEHFDQIDHHDIVLTTYSLLPRDQAELVTHQFYYIVLDESQWIKNARTRAARVAGELVAEHRLCVTGTPLENNLGEVWSQFNFLMPGFLGNQEAFNKRFRHPIERRADALKSEALARRLAPFILRRTKQQVASELPDKVEMESLVSLDQQQAALYEAVRATMEKRVRDVLMRHGLARSHITILDALLKLRQVCCDPRLVKLEQAAGVEQSAKLAHLLDILPDMLAEGRKVLLFSQFTSMLALIESELVDRDISFSVLTGQTRRREEAINAFQEGDAQVFLISLKAGGVGLNLTAADTVILYDPWWNPAVERQAIDRAHRIGQDKTVFVYRLIVENSIEQKILTMQAGKQRLADSLIDSDEGSLKALNADDILGLFSGRDTGE